MAKFLRVDGTSNSVWRLPSDTDLVELGERLEVAMEAGTPVRVRVEIQDNPLGSGTVIVHAGKVWAIVLVDRPEPDAKAPE